MKITRIGHACVLLEGSKNVIIDTFINDNPAAKLSMNQLPKVDFVLSTHDHFDHFGPDTIEIAKRDNAKIVGIHELTVKEEIKAADIEAVGMNIGGTYSESGVSISLTPAVHSSQNGSPTGIVVNMDGKTVYHAGDTGVFSDMKLIPELFGKIDVALLPIGGHYTMDEEGAARAVSFLKPELVVPIHYNTWPPIAADTDKFAGLCAGYNVRVVEPGESIDIS